MRIAYEATELCSERGSGIGRYVRALLGALAAAAPAAGLDLTAWYRRSYRKDAGFIKPPAGVRTACYQGNWWPLRVGADVVHGPGVRTPRWRGARVASLMDLTPFTNPGNLPAERVARDQRWYRDAAAHAHAFIAISAATKAEAVVHLGIPAARIHVTWLGVDPRFCPQDPALLTALRQRLDLPERFLLAVGDVHPRKNLPRLVAALAAARCDLPLVVAGREAGGGEALAAAIAAHAPPGGVRRLDFVAEADLAPLYAAATGLCYPSLAEGFGFPIIEAMRCGTAVLTSDTTSCPEVAGGHAMLVDPLQVESIAAGIDRLLALTPAQRAAAQAWGEGFTWERCAAETIAVYRSAVAAA
jgi:glycosyltransferase involved in cell wall biosynthesis